MKKSTITMLIILAVIAGLHFALLYIFFMHRDADQRNPAVAPALIPQPPEPQIVLPPSSGADESHPVQTPVQKKKSAAPSPRKSNIPDAKLRKLLKEVNVGSLPPKMEKTETEEIEVGEGDAETITVVRRGFDYSKALRGVLKSVPNTKLVKSGILLDPQTRRVLWTVSPQEQVPIASMTKMMTLLVALEKLSSRKDISLRSLITVSKTAPLVAPTRLGLRAGQPITVEELLKAMIIKSANDAAQMVAEAFGNGNAAEFVAEMNRRAQQLGMKSTRFFNPHGLPGKSARVDNISTCEDMAILSQALMNYPLAREWVGSKTAQVASGFNEPITLYNHNKLLKSTACPGINGIKTGFTARAGFCIAVNCHRSTGRLIAVITGVQSSKERDALVSKLVNWGYLRQAALSGAVKKR